jgi:hypothetical protein
MLRRRLFYFAVLKFRFANNLLPGTAPRAAYAEARLYAATRAFEMSEH